MATKSEENKGKDQQGEARMREVLDRREAMDRGPTAAPPVVESSPEDPGEVTLQEIADELGIPAHEARMRLRRVKRGPKQGGSWTYTPAQARDVRRMLGGK